LWGKNKNLGRLELATRWASTGCLEWVEMSRVGSAVRVVKGGNWVHSLTASQETLTAMGGAEGQRKATQRVNEIMVGQAVFSSTFKQWVVSDTVGGKSVK